MFKCKFLLSILLFFAMQMVGAQTTKNPEYFFDERDTIDIYSFEKAVVKGGYDKGTGYTDGWKVECWGNYEYTNRDKDGIGFTFTPPTSYVSEKETYSVSVRLLNYSSRGDTLLDVRKRYVIRVFPVPFVSVLASMCDDMDDLDGYKNYTLLTRKDSVRSMSHTSYATHVLRLYVPAFATDSAMWSWKVNGEPVYCGDQYVHQYSNEEADVNGMKHSYSIEMAHQLEYREKPFVFVCNFDAFIYPYPVAGVNTAFETYSGMKGGFTFIHSGGVKDCWEWTWSDLDGNEYSDEEMASLSVDTDKKVVNWYKLYVRNGVEGSGYYYGNAYLQHIVWPAPSAECGVMVNDSSAVACDKDGVVEVDCYEDDIIKFDCQVKGGFDDIASWYAVLDGRDSTSLYKNANMPRFRAMKTGAEVDGDGCEVQTHRLRIINEYSRANMSHDSIWFDKEYTLVLKVHLRPELSSAITLTDCNQGRVMNKGGYICIRTGNRLGVEAEEIKYMDADEYKCIHTWGLNGTVKEGDKDKVEVKMDLGAFKYGKYVEDYDVTYQGALYRDGSLISQTSEITEAIKVYNRPHTPTALMMKGSGLTHTLIASSDVSDANLMLYDYYLVFGYENPDGSVVEKAEQVQSGEGKCRFEKSFTTAELLDSSKRFFVYAQWCYDDGVTVTSGKCYKDGRDEEWDGSDYSGKGGTIALVRGRQTTGVESAGESGERVVSVTGIDGVRKTDGKSGVRIVRYSDGSVKKVLY